MFADSSADLRSADINRNRCRVASVIGVAATMTWRGRRQLIILGERCTFCPAVGPPSCWVELGGPP